jgi:hypothetical protein
VYSSTLSLTSVPVAGGWLSSLPVALPRERDSVPIVQEAGWASRPVWMGAENLTQNRDSFPGLFSPYRVAIPTELFWPTLPSYATSETVILYFLNC